MDTKQNQIPSVGNYIAVQLLGVIPVVGFILMIVWAVGGAATPIWKRNYARAFFVMFAILLGLTIAFSGVILGLASSLSGNLFNF